MTPTMPQYGSDAELQADVMRFMAIIAFCLIAILALVRNVTPAETETAVEAEREAVSPPPPATIDAPVPPPAKATAPRPEPVPKPVSRREPVAAVAEPIPEAPAEPVAKPAPVTREATPASPPEPAPIPESEQEQGLILRFASDGDFLRLIARGDIKVYAYQERDVLTLSEAYQFLETRAPGQVYELMRDSIPALVVDALRRARPDMGGYRWGVVLPGRISHQIETYLGQVEDGQLVIDRFGDVHHVAAS